MHRRTVTAALAAWPLLAAADPRVCDALRTGGVVIAFRHALAPGTFDPPGFRLDDCRTQRKLSDEGSAERWDALASPTGSEDSQRQRRLAELRQALAAVPARRFEAWVTHQFVLQDLAGRSTVPAEALVLRATAGGGVELLASALLSSGP